MTIEVLQQLAIGREVLSRPEVDKNLVEQAITILHPTVEDEPRRSLLAGALRYGWAKFQQPYTRESLAEQLANRSGAFP